jgi:hypothetical protein
MPWPVIVVVDDRVGIVLVPYFFGADISKMATLEGVLTGSQPCLSMAIDRCRGIKSSHLLTYSFHEEE